MIRFLSLSAVALSVLTPALAQTYRAVPSVAKSGPVVAGDVLWRCGSDGCMTTKISARPAIACAQVVKKVGRIESFSSDAAPFDSDALAKCNARAKGAETAIARN